MLYIYIYIHLNTNKTVSKPPSYHVSKIYNSIYFDPTSESSSASTMKGSKYTGKVQNNITVIKLLNRGLLCLKFQVTLAKL